MILDVSGHIDADKLKIAAKANGIRKSRAAKKKKRKQDREACEAPDDPKQPL